MLCCVLKRTLALEVVSPHFIFRRAKVVCRPVDWEEYSRSGEAEDVLPHASTLVDNHAEIEIVKDGDYYWLEMADVVIETTSRDKTFEIPFYIYCPAFSSDEARAAGPLRIKIDDRVVYAVTVLDRTGRPINSGILRFYLPQISMTITMRLADSAKGGSILFLGNPTHYVFDLSDEFGLKILPA